MGIITSKQILKTKIEKLGIIYSHDLDYMSRKQLKREYKFRKEQQKKYGGCKRKNKRIRGTNKRRIGNSNMYNQNFSYGRRCHYY